MTAKRELFQRVAPAVLDANGSALLRAVCDDPDDLEMRTVYADLLGELDDPRGEYIQLALRTDPTEGEATRRDELFDRHAPEWQRPLLPADPVLRGALRDLGFSRGFVEKATIQIRRFEILDWLIARTPLRELSVSDYEAAPGWGEQLAEHPVLHQLHGLEIFASGVIEPIVRKGDLRKLEALTLAGLFTTSLARAVAESCPSLRRLTIRHTGVDPIEAEALEALATLPLRELELSSATIDEAGAAALASMTTLSRLRLVSVSGQLRPLGALRSKLDSLDLVSMHLGAALAPFLAQTALRELISLDLQRNQLTPDDLASALSELRAGTLQELVLSSNPVGESGAAALSLLPALSKLERLRASQCGLDAGAFAALARAEWPLKRAELGLNVVDESAAKALAEGPLLRSLRTLNLSMAKLGSKAARVLGAAPWLEGVESLFLFSNKMGNTGLRALLEQMPNARDLSLCRENTFKEEGLLLAARGLFPKLQHLRVDEVTSKNIVAFVESGFADDLRGAYFGNSQISVEAARALASLPKVGRGGTTWSGFEPGALDILKERWPRWAT